MKSLLSILVSVALIGVLFAGDTVRYKERTRTKTYSHSSSASCAGKSSAACVGSVKMTTRINKVGCAGSSCSGSSSTRTVVKSRTR